MEENKLKKTQDTLLATILKDDVEKKVVTGKELTYLSWAAAWNTVLKVCPEASYEVQRFGEDKLPYQNTEFGLIVWTKVTIEGVTKEMWLPVLDGRNESMGATDREIVTKAGKFVVKKADMSDINKAIMRCLVKNLAMFGLGLYLYKGEDLPDVDDVDLAKKREPVMCQECGKEITDFDRFTAEQIIGLSKKKFGKCLCYDCSVKQSHQPKGDNQ